MSIKVMIIEDEPDVIEYLNTVLTANGYETVVCGDTRSAADMIKKHRPDLICLDIMMPRETGLSFYVRLKAMDTFRNIPVVMISGAIQQGEFDFRAYVPDRSIPPPERFIEKPIMVDDFLETIAILTSAGKTAGKEE
nr:response regulator [candidate division Zixibacteria bacterium]